MSGFELPGSAARTFRPAPHEAQTSRHRTWWLFVGLIALVLLPHDMSAQCAMCRRALQSPEGLQMISALRRGIVLLLAAPFLSFGVVAYLAVRAQRRRERASESSR